MSRQAMMIDLVRCVGCGACVVACEEEWGLPVGVHRNWVRPLLPVASSSGLVHAHFVGLCNHCGRASCVEACPTGATYRDPRGRVVVDLAACIGCGHCVDACPYGARTLRPDAGHVEKCDLCAARVDAGLQPVCVETCPAGARVLGDLDERDGAVARAVASGRLRRLETPQVSIDPHVYYAGDDRVIDRILAEHPPDPARVRGAAAAGTLGTLRGGFFGLLGLVLAGEAVALVRQLLRRERRPPAERQAAEPRVRRHDAATIFLHWFNALVWLWMLVTGLAMLGGSRYRMLPGGAGEALLGLAGSRGTMAHLHIGVGVLWALVLLVYGVLGFRRHLLPFLGHLRLGAADRSWLEVKARRMLLRRDDELPPQGKYNAGQKLFGLVVAAGSAALLVSGFVMLGAAGQPARWAVVVHFAGMAAVLLGLVVHLFMSTLLSSERPTLFSMFHGWIPASHARAHSRLWWEQVRGDAEAGPQDQERESSPSERLGDPR
jgi:formate dehydrogenase gamma subunit